MKYLISERQYNIIKEQFYSMGSPTVILKGQDVNAAAKGGQINVVDSESSGGYSDNHLVKNIKDYSKKTPTTQVKKEVKPANTSVAEYQGGKGVYTSDRWVSKYQTALSMIGYKLPYSCKAGKCDGKFGPETKRALESFQKSNGLTSSLGKMDRLTARKLAEVLKTKNIKGSKSIQMAMNAA